MSDYNLGTAHGRILIDLDDRGTAQTVRAMRDIDRAAAQSSFSMELFGYAADYADRTVGRFSRALDAITGPFEDLSGAGLRAFNTINMVTNRLTMFAVAGQLVGAVATGVLAAGMNVTSVAAVGLATSIITMTGIVAGVPGVISTAIFAFAAFKIAFGGMGDAIKAAASGDMKKMEEAIKDLAPAAQGLVRTIGTLAPKFKELKKSIQGKMFTGLAVDVGNLANVYLPMLENKLGRISTAGNTVMKSLATMMQEGSRIKQVDIMGTAAAVTMENLAGSVAPVVGGFMHIAEVGAVMFAGATGGAARAGIAFQAWAKHAKETGKIKDMITAAWREIKTFGRVLLLAGQIASNVFKIAGAAGGGFLNRLETILFKVKQFTQSFEGMQAIGGIFRVITAVSETMLPVFEALVKMIGTKMAPGFAQLINLIGPKLVPFIEALGEAWARMSSGIPALADMFNRLMDAITPLLPVIGQSLADNIRFFAQAIKIVAPPIQKLIQLFTSLPVPVQAFLLGFLVLAPVIAKVIFSVGRFIAILGIMAAITGKSSLAMKMLGIAPDKAGKKFHFLRRVIVTLFKPLSQIVTWGARLAKVKWLTTGLSKLVKIAGPLGRVASAFSRFARVGAILRGVASSAQFLLNVFKVSRILWFFLHPIAAIKLFANAVWLAARRVVMAVAMKIAAWARAAAAAVASATRAAAAWVAASARIVAAYIRTAAVATASMLRMAAVTVAGWIRIAAVTTASAARMAAVAIAAYTRKAVAATVSMARMAAATVAGWAATTAAAVAGGARMAAAAVAAYTRQAVAAATGMARTVAATVGGWIAATAAATTGAARMAAASVAAYARVAVASTVNMARIVATTVAGWVVTGASAAAGMAVMVATTVAGWAVMAAGAVARMAVIVTTTVVGWIVMAASSMAGAIAMAAAWFIALGPVGWVIAIVIALVALIIANWDTVKQWTITAWNAIVAAVVAAWNWIKSSAASIWNGIKAFFVTTWAAIKLAFTLAVIMIRIAVLTAWVWIVTQTQVIWQRIKLFFTTLWAEIKGRFTMAVMMIRVAVLTAWIWIVTQTTIIWQRVKMFFTTLWAEIKGRFTMAVAMIRIAVLTAWVWIVVQTQTIWNNIKIFFITLWGEIKGRFQAAVAMIRSWVATAWDWIRTKTSDAWNAIKEFIRGAWEAIKNYVQTNIQRARDLINDVWEWIKNKTRETWEAVKQRVSDGVQGVIRFVQELPGRIRDFFSNAGRWLMDAGRAIMRGLLDGIKAAWDAVAGYLSDVAGRIKALKGPINKDKVMLKPEGSAIMQGLLAGMKNGANPMFDWVGTIADRVRSLVNSKLLAVQMKLAGKNIFVGFADAMGGAEGRIKKSAAGMRASILSVAKSPAMAGANSIGNPSSPIRTRIATANASSTASDTRAAAYAGAPIPSAGTRTPVSGGGTGDTYNLYTTVPQGATVKQLSETLTFDLRHAGKGVYK